MNIVTLPGDGIGPEVLAAALEVLNEVAPDLTYEEHLVGGAAIDATGTALPDETLSACKQADAVLLAAVGGPKWDTTDPDKPRPEQGLLGLRSGLGLFANLRPVRPLPALYDASPLRHDIIERTDLLVVRELTGGIYFGEKTRDERSASDVCAYTVEEVERIARIGFEAARSRVTSVDKANVLETSRLWREVVSRVHSAEYPNIELQHLLVDNAAMQLVSNPRHFDVIHQPRDYRLVAWVVMPNHVHVILRREPHTTLSDIVRRWKSWTAHRINEIDGGLVAAVEREAFDRSLRIEDEDALNAIRYVELNPVKGGLCRDPLSWEFSSARRFPHRWGEGS